MAQMAPQPLPHVEHLQGQNYLFSWEGVPGRVYFIQTSSSLTASEFDWEFAPDIRVGTGSQIEMGFQANAAHFEFFRLVYSDYSGGMDPDLADFDNDGYTNLEEAISNTDPYDAQSYPGSGGNTGGGNNGASSGSGTTWNHPWEYRLTYTFDGYVEEDFINPYNSVGGYSYAMGEEIVTELSFEDVVEVNQVKFLQIEPNLNYDSSDPASEEWNVIGIVELSAENPNWSYEAPVGTMPEGFLLPVEVAEVIEANHDETAGCTGYDEKENVLMVPMQGSNKIKVKIVGAPQELLQKMKFVSEPAGKLTIVPEVPIAAEQELTLTGVAVGLGVKIQIEIDGTKIELFEADVLKKRTENLVLHAIVDSNTNEAVAAPQAAQIKLHLNRALGPQANVFFDNVWILNENADYDLNDSGTLDNQAELENLATNLALARANALDVYIVKNLNPGNNGMAFKQVGIAVVDEVPEKCDLEFVVTHEIGHLLGRDGHHEDAEYEKYLMSDAEVSACGCIVGEVDWKLMNP